MPGSRQRAGRIRASLCSIRSWARKGGSSEPHSQGVPRSRRQRRRVRYGVTSCLAVHVQMNIFLKKDNPCHLLQIGLMHLNK